MCEEVFIRCSYLECKLLSGGFLLALDDLAVDAKAEDGVGDLEVLRDGGVDRHQVATRLPYNGHQKFTNG